MNIQVSTPIKPEKLKQWLQGYDKEKTKFLYEGFSLGFKIPFDGQEEALFSKNLKSANTNLEILKEKIQKEVEAGRVVGPFEDPPFQNFKVSPLGLVPKKNPGEFRVIHHLSYPTGASVNDGISPDFTTVQYQSIDDAVELMIKYGKNCLLSKIDIEQAFKIMPIHKSCCHLLGFMLDNKYYFDKTLPMGLSYS